MRPLVPAVLAALVAGVVGVGDALAQEKGAMELGFDLGFTAAFFDGATAVSFGVPRSDYAFLRPQSVRVGYLMTARAELEPRFGFNFINANDATVWALDLGVDYIQNFPSGGTTPFVRLGPSMWLLGNPDETLSQFGVGVGAGLRTREADRLALRVQAGVSHYFENNDFPSHWDVGVGLGVSFFTR